MASYADVVLSARQAFATGKTKSVEWRIKQLKGLMKMYEENDTLFYDALDKDLRKPKWESMAAEVENNKNDIIGALREIKEWTADKHTKKNMATLMDKTLIRPEPFGVVLIIGSWNYPLHISLAPMTGAIAAGNCAVIKPSEISPHTAKAIEMLLPKYVDPDCFKVVVGGVEETTALLKERFDYIFYTGSTQVGRIIREAANKHLTPCTLELGGKSPVFIGDDCNIDVATRRILWGKMINLGQTCIAPDYVLCSKNMQKKFVEKVKEVCKEWFGENPEESPDLCRVVSDRHFDRLESLISSSTGRIVFGGKVEKKSRFIELTVLADLSPEDRVMREEIFGPILPIINVDSASEAIEFINNREKPLTLYLFTEDSHIQEMFMSNTSSGGMAINETIMQMSVESLPFGGVGESGMGAYHGKASFDTFTHYKSILIRDLGFIGEKVGSIRYPPYNNANLGLFRALLKNRKVPDLDWIAYPLTFAAGVVAMFVTKTWIDIF